MHIRLRLTISFLLIVSSAAIAQESSPSKIQFDIPSQSLSSALLDYSYQSKVQLIMPGSYAKGLYSKRIFGLYEPAQALQLLLKDSRLQFEFISPKTVSISLANRVVSKKSQRRFQRNDVSSIDQIIVTAQGREEKIQDVSLAVTAIEGEDLEKRGVSNADELQVFVPGLTVESSQMTDTSFTIRGIGASNDDITIDPGVGVFIDDIYIPRQSAANMMVYDLERVEVLRGPQGTLYGKNTTGGAVRYLSHKPTEDYEARYLVDVGSYGLFNNTLTLNGEIADQFYAQLGVAFLHRSGFMKNTSASQPDGNEQHAVAARSSFRYLPNEGAELLMTIDTEKTDQSGTLFSVGPQDGFQLSSLTAPLPASNPIRSANATFTGADKRDIDGLMLRANLETESAMVSYIVGARQHNIQSAYDLDQQVDAIASRAIDENSNLLTGEIRFISKRDSNLSLKGKLEWAAGIYYAKERGRIFKPYDLSGLGYGQNAWTQSIISQSYAFYGQSDFAINSELRFTMGLRYTIDDKDVDILAFTEIPSVNNPLIRENLQYTKAKRWTGVTPKIALSYSTSEDVLFYSSYTQGYKAGGFNGSLRDQNSLSGAELAAEKSHHYELGMKSRFFDNRAKFNLVVFYIDYNYLQVREYVALGNTEISSVPESVVNGFEVELQARPTSSLNLSVGVSALDTEIGRFEMMKNGVQVDRRGDPIPGVPDVTVNASIAYFLPETNKGFYSARIDGIYSDKALSDETNLAWPNYRIYNLWLDFMPHGGKWELGVWVRNLLDEVYYRGALPSFLAETNSSARKLEAPRTAGVSFKYKW